MPRRSPALVAALVALLTVAAPAAAAHYSPGSEGAGGPFYGNVTTADFIALSERVSGRQLDALFDAWLYQEGRPAACDA